MCSCGKAGPLKDITPGLTEAQKKSYESRRLRSRAKNAERSVAAVMAFADGEDSDYEKVASKNGRVGFITGMRIDAVSRSYVTEAKNRKLPLWLIKAWVLLQQKGREHNKNILLYVQPPNMPSQYIFGTAKIKSENMHIVAESRHEELIRRERAFNLALPFLETLSQTNDEIKILLKEVRSILETNHE